MFKLIAYTFLFLSGVYYLFELNFYLCNEHILFTFARNFNVYIIAAVWTFLEVLSLVLIFLRKKINNTEFGCHGGV